MTGIKILGPDTHPKTRAHPMSCLWDTLEMPFHFNSLFCLLKSSQGFFSLLVSRGLDFTKEQLKKKTALLGLTLLIYGVRIVPKWNNNIFLNKHKNAQNFASFRERLIDVYSKAIIIAWFLTVKSLFSTLGYKGRFQVIYWTIYIKHCFLYNLCAL